MNIFKRLISLSILVLSFNISHASTNGNRITIHSLDSKIEYEFEKVEVDNSLLSDKGIKVTAGEGNDININYNSERKLSNRVWTNLVESVSDKANIAVNPEQSKDISMIDFYIVGKLKINGSYVVGDSGSPARLYLAEYNSSDMYWLIAFDSIKAIKRKTMDHKAYYYNLKTEDGSKYQLLQKEDKSIYSCIKDR